MKKIIWAIMFLILVGCNSKIPQLYEDTVFDSKAPEIDKIQKQYESIKSIRDIFDTKIEIYYQETENSEIYRIPSYDKLPDNDKVYATYEIIRNKDNKIIYISRYPVCPSSDWIITYESFFDDEGNLITFKKRQTFQNYIDKEGNSISFLTHMDKFSPLLGCDSACAEESVYFYNKSHTLLKKTFVFFKDYGNSIADCKTTKKNIPIDYQIFTTFDEYLSKYKFKFDKITIDDNKSNSIAENDNQSNSNEENIENANFPMSKYFKITKVFDGEYNKERGFYMDFEIMNISDYKFSSVDLHGDTYCKMKNSDEICRSTVQTDDWVVDNKKNNWPHQVVNWQPNTTRHISFTCPTWCNITFDRTPEELNLILKINAISIDKEVEGIFVNYDVLRLWKDRQVKEGLR